MTSLNPQDQIAELKKLASLCGKKYRVDCGIKCDLGDVPACFAFHLDEGKGSIEAVCATGRYDIWENGNLTEPDVSIELAAKKIAADYCAMKARIVARRWLRETIDDPKDIYAEALDKTLKYHMGAN